MKGVHQGVHAVVVIAHHTFGTRVTAYRSGLLPQAIYVEGGGGSMLRSNLPAFTGTIHA